MTPAQLAAAAKVADDVPPSPLQPEPWEMPMTVSTLRRARTAVLATALAVGLGWLAAPPAAAADDAFTLAQKEQLDKLIETYILNHPEVIVEAVRRMQVREEAEKQAAATAALKAKKDELEHDPHAPLLGNPQGKVTVVEFFDYRCGYCKRVFPSVMQLLADDSNIRYVLKEFPILGPESVAASKAALAVWRADKSKYAEFHSALMTSSGGLPESKILGIAAHLGIDKDQLKRDMADPAIEKIL
ncbi:MAG: DsbA family protein, partial [Rhodospirillaceae bacterium]